MTQMTKEKWHRFSCVRCEIDFYCKFQRRKKQMAIVRMMRVYLKSKRTCFLSFSGPRSDGLLTRLALL